MKNLKHVVSRIVIILTVGLIYSCVQDHRIPEPSEVVTIEGVATAEFPINSIKVSNVKFNKTSDPDIEYTFNETADIFRVGPKISYQTILDIGTDPPQNDSIRVTFNLPEDFINSIPNNYGVELFAMAYQDGGEDVLDVFEIISSKYNATNRTITALLPTWVFTNKRNAGGTYEAIFMIGATPGKNSGGRLAALVGPCQAGQISCPIGSNSQCTQSKTSDFSNRKDPISGKDAIHWGVDFGISVGTPIYASSDGRIEKVRTQTDRKGNVIGYGLYIVVRHSNGSATLYGHLSGTSVQVGQAVNSNQQIGASGSSGKSTGPHLHFEYVPNGEIILSKSRIDPLPCITDGNVNGSITIRDNGNLADDAFALYLDNILIGSTQIGKSNSLALNNLRPGEKTLKLVCTIAPDNVGTYEVLLNDGIVFKGDGNRMSSTLPQGGTIEWQVTIPQSNINGIRSLAGPAVSQPNKYVEK